MFRRLFITVLLLTIVLCQDVENSKPSSAHDSNSVSIPITEGENSEQEASHQSACVKKQVLLDEMEAVIDEFVAFGITDEHATEFMDWIVNEVVESKTMKENGEEIEAECFPPERIDEMGTRLGKMIAQDIAGERPSKRGRAIQDFESDEESDESSDEGKDLGQENDQVVVRKATTTPARKSNPFRFGNKSHNSQKSVAPQKCCKCPRNHYPNGTRKNNPKCKKGPCCPKLCRTLERLAGALSSARFSCCQKAHRKCIDDDRKMFMKAAWEKKKRFNFDLLAMKIANSKNKNK